MSDVTARMTDALADRLALALIEHGPTSAARLALAVAARKADVLRELRASARFERAGAGRASRWRLAPPTNAWEPKGTGWEPKGIDYPTGVGVSLAEDFGVRLAAIERRLDALERRNGNAAAPA